MVREALRSEPLSARGFRILGQVAAIGGDEARAARYMGQAAALSIRESAAVLWRLNHRLAARDIAGALEDANALLHTRPQLATAVIPVLARLSELKQGRAKLVALLARRPPWRSQFLGALPRLVQNLESPLGLYLALAKTAAPPSDGEIAAYLNHLIAKRRYALAYYTWLQFLPPGRLTRVGIPYNGDFRFEPSGQPFDWRLDAPDGAWSQIAHVPASRGNRALLIEFFGRRAPFRHVSQVVFLGPGRYRFSGRTKAKLKAARGLVWRILCLTSGTRILETRPFRGAIEAWQTFESTFAVPAKGCPAQLLRLELIAHAAVEEKALGEIWFDDLKISRTR